MLNDLERCLNDLKANYDRVYREYGLSELLIALAKLPNDTIYPYKLKSLSDKYEQILGKYDKNILEEIRKIVLLECVISSWNDIFSDKYTKSIQEQYTRSFNRFLEISSRAQGWGEYIEDVYWKDLSLARQQMFPVGPLVVESYSGFGCRQGLNTNILQSLKFLKFLFLSEGREGYYQTHVHTPLLKEFNEEGWIYAYRCIAEMLKKRKKIKGVFGVAWFRDPQIANLSPRLAYLHKIPSENGGKHFSFGEDRTGNAFAKSKTRMKLYNEGKYQPMSYMMVWPRKELIVWAEQFKKSKQSLAQ